MHLKKEKCVSWSPAWSTYTIAFVRKGYSQLLTKQQQSQKHLRQPMCLSSRHSWDSHTVYAEHMHSASPLLHAVKKEAPWRWQTDQEKAFIEAKAFLKSPKLLVHYDGCEEFDPNKLRLTSGTGSSTGTLHGR